MALSGGAPRPAPGYAHACLVSRVVEHAPRPRAAPASRRPGSLLSVSVRLAVSARLTATAGAHPRQLHRRRRAAAAAAPPPRRRHRYRAAAAPRVA